MQAIPGVAKIKDGYNPATWMLEVTNIGVENTLGVDFADLYLKSDLYQWVPVFQMFQTLFWNIHGDIIR